MTLPTVTAGAGSPTLVALMSVFLEALRARGRVTFVLADDLGSKHGLVSLDDAMVLLDTRNTDGEMCATITHELLHLVAPDGTEDEIEAETARMLVPLEAALAARATGQYAQIAEALLVDEALVRQRLRSSDTGAVQAASGIAG